MTSASTRYVVVGGGIAGVSCAETLRMKLHQDERSEILLLTSSSVVKATSNVNQLTQTLVEFDIEETTIQAFVSKYPGVKIRSCNVAKIIPEKYVLVTNDGDEIGYSKLCICTGARPKLIDESCPYLLGIRDTQTVKDLETHLASARKVVVIGNGGIAMELVYALTNIDIVWVIKDKSIGTTFLDCGAAEFLISEFKKSSEAPTDPLKPDPRRSKYTVFNLSNNTSVLATEVSGGSALGPDWNENALLEGIGTKNLSIEYECELKDIHPNSQVPDLKKDDWPVYVILSNGKIIGCDFIVSATGVIPNTDLFKNQDSSEIMSDGGIKVDDNMRVVGLKDVYAAGDVCTCAWEKSPHWQQMRLWTQARQMGIYAAQCMISHNDNKEDLSLDFCFEIFAHVTRFFGHKIVLLGKFNGQGINKEETQLIVRITPGKEYVKVLLKEGRMYGAVLVGETDLEETFENLILNGMDLSQYGENLLHPNLELEDYFD